MDNVAQDKSIILENNLVKFMKNLEKSNSAKVIDENTKGGMIKSSSGTLLKEGDSLEIKKSNSAVKVGKLKHSQTFVINENPKDLPNIKSARMLTS